jgi:hypothetical protein
MEAKNNKEEVTTKPTGEPEAPNVFSVDPSVNVPSIHAPSVPKKEKPNLSIEITEYNDTVPQERKHRIIPKNEINEALHRASQQ